MRRRSVWIVSHFEYLGPPYWRDELIAYVATTKTSVFRFLRETHVDPGTWWGVQRFPVDDRAFPAKQMLYSRAVRPMRSGYSLKRALKLSRKLRARNAARFRRFRRDQTKKGGTEHAPSRPR